MVLLQPGFVFKKGDPVSGYPWIAETVGTELVDTGARLYMLIY